MLKKILILFFFFVNVFTVFSYEVDLPTINSNIKTEYSIDTSNNNYYIDVSKIITKYLWYFLWVVSFAVVLYAWVLLLKSEWDQQELKKANKMLIWGMIWIFTSLLAYSIVNVIIKLW